ncbi:hypothetical protein PSPO01_13974 [Paraphaeosphaeria sporulosa]
MRVMASRPFCRSKRCICICSRVWHAAPSCSLGGGRWVRCPFSRGQREAPCSECNSAEAQTARGLQIDTAPTPAVAHNVNTCFEAAHWHWHWQWQWQWPRAVSRLRSSSRPAWRWPH